MNNLKEYLKNNLIRFEELSESTVKIGNQTYELIYPNSEGKLFDDSFEMTCDDTVEDNYIFNFGGNYYWTPKGTETNPQLFPLRYIGEQEKQVLTDNFLGIHGSYEALNGSRLYSDWINKATFLGCKCLGICEKNTLAGVLKFQSECKKNKLKSVLGATYTVFRQEGDFRYNIKLYVKDQLGWDNILKINKEVNVINNKFITEERLLELLEGLFIVVDPKSLDYNKLNPSIKSKIDYYQLDTVEYVSNERDQKYLINLKEFVNSNLKPISITDAFYLDKDQSEIKKVLNSISGIREYESDNQYFKSKDEYFDELEKLFNIEDDSVYDIFEEALKNEQYLVDNCNYQIDTGKKYLPKYIMTNEEKQKYGDNINMFWSLIEEGLNKKVKKENQQRYRDQIQKEYEIIEYGNLQDYFLINWEQIEWCKKNNIMTGLSRGSAAGFQTSNILGITQIDPFDYDLIAERFLTKERAKHRIADIDIDHEQKRRDEVKQHLIDKYGFDQCCSVGTYSTFQIKGGLKDIAKIKNVSFAETNQISSILENECKEWNDIFRLSSQKSRLKAFVKENTDVINLLNLILNSKKSTSIHASAFIITPSDKTIYEWIPVRLENKDGVNILVSEWEGTDLEEFGSLKQDVLGLLQIDKFHRIIDLIKENKGVDIDIYNIPLDDKKTYSYFGKKWNSDVFQFGTKGLSDYCVFLNPQNINDLIAAVALYRPGAMENNFHNEYVLRKNGEREVEYYSGTEEITKNTYGLLCLYEDSNISTSNGIKKIKDIQIGDLIINEDGEYDEVIDVQFNGKKETIKVLANFGEELILTPDHKVLTQKGWVQAQSLTKKDLIKGYWVTEEKNEDIDDNLALEHWLIGYFIAEGSSKDKSSPYFTVGSYELALKLEKVIHNVLKNKCYIHITEHENGTGGISFRVNVKSTDKKYNGYFCSDYKENELKSLLKKYNLHDKRFDTKSLPTNYSIHTIAGIIEGDGCLSLQILRMKNKQLILDIFHSLQSYRIFCSCKHYEDGVSEIYFRDDDNKLKFRIHDIEKRNCLKQYIPSNEVLIDYKKIKPEVRKRYFTESKINNSFLSYDVLNRIKEGVIGVKHDIWGKIKKIEKCDICNVYDLSIRNKHSFVSGGLVVHNCYQEQIMQICQKLAGFDLSETDDIRKALGKKKAEILEPYKQRFIQGSIKNGYDEFEMIDLWNAMEKFSGYSFNLSHAAAYGITGYISQWLKANYPIEFWITAFDLGDDKYFSDYISEIYRSGDIKIATPEINKSSSEFTVDYDTNTIYWSITSVKQAGEISQQQIEEDKKLNGHYFSFEEFLSRHVRKGSKVTKQIIENLVLSGVFDEIEEIKQPKDRIRLIDFYRKEYKIKIDKEKDQFTTNEDSIGTNWWWSLQQKKICGFSLFEFDLLCETYLAESAPYYDAISIDEEREKKEVMTGGYLNELVVRNGKKGEYAEMTLDNNFEFVTVKIWQDEWKKVKPMVDGKEKILILLSGTVDHDNWKKKNILYMNKDSSICVLE